MKLFSLKKVPVKEEEKEELLFSIELDQKVIHLPDFEDKTEFDVEYPLIKPFASVHIHYDADLQEVVYRVDEPELDEGEKETFRILEEGIRELINISFVNIKDTKVITEYLEKNARILLDEIGIKVGNDTFLKLMYYLYRNFVGLNEIESLMHDYFIEDIECNGINTPLYIIHRKYRNLRTNIVFEDHGRLASFVEKLAQKCGKYVSYATPLLDGRLPNGDRVNAVYTPDISTRGATFTIRRFTREPWTPVKLMDFRTVSPEILAYFWILIEYEANLMIIGGTGSGKTSFLNSLAFFIPPASRVVSIEDTKELNLLHENWLPSVAREGTGLADILGQKHGEVSLFDLLKESFRQRPDYVIVGEIRGKEAFVLFQGASSGHPTMATMHAESVEAMLRRLETEPINLSPALIEALDVVGVMIETKVAGKSVRRIKEVVEIKKVGREGDAITNTPFVRNPADDKFYFKTNSIIFDKIIAQYGIPKERLNREFTLRAKLLYSLYKNGVFGFKEVQEVINAYYRDQEAVLKKFGIA